MATEAISSNLVKSGILNPNHEDHDSGTSNPDSDSDDKALIKKEKPLPKSSISPRPKPSSQSLDSHKSSDNLFRRTSSHCGAPTVPCPTCSGKGKLSQAQSDTMLALIPMHDQRLKPKRTKLKLAVIFILLVIIGGMCFAFLYPRTVAIAIQSVHVERISNYTNGNIRINMSVLADLNNTNFFTINIPNLTTQVLFLDTKDQLPHEVGSLVINKTIRVGLRKTVKKPFSISTFYKDMDAKIVRKICFLNKLYFLIKVQLTATVKYWLHSEQISNTKFYYVDCNASTATANRPLNNSKPLFATNEQQH